MAAGLSSQDAARADGYQGAESPQGETGRRGTWPMVAAAAAC